LKTLETETPGKTDDNVIGINMDNQENDAKMMKMIFSQMAMMKTGRVPLSCLFPPSPVCFLIILICGGI
jgi:hypothetical protein